MHIADIYSAYTIVRNKTGGNLIIFWMFSLLRVLIWDFLFIKSPPVLSIFKKKFPPRFLFGTPVIFGTRNSHMEPFMTLFSLITCVSTIYCAL